MVAFILPANSATGGFNIDNSLRFNDGDTAYLNRTRSSQSNTTGTFSVWTKMGNVNVDNVLFGGATDVNNRSYIYFSDPDGFVGIFSRTSGSADIAYNSNAKFRDPSAWYHVVVAIDTTDGTAGNRFKMYINGTQYTDWGTATAPSQNASLPILNQAAQTVGGGFGASAISSMAEGYMADAYYIDGSALAPTEFGETNDNGVWIPKKYLGTYGTNGFKLEFQETGTGTASASTIGADTSGNDNHLTSNNLAATDVTTDTPTNNFCTLNPLDVYASSGGALSEGNTKLVVTTSELHTAAGTFAPTNGKWYWEVELDATDGSNPSNVGISDLARDTKANMPSKLAWGYGYNASTGNKQNSGTNSSYGDSYGAGDIVSVAMDLDNGAVYFAKNGTFQASGDPTSGASKTNAAFTWTPDNTMNWAPYVADNTSGVSFTWLTNFGNAPFAISSGNSDGAGYGNFEYAVPSGFYSLCTKNLAEYG